MEAEERAKLGPGLAEVDTAFQELVEVLLDGAQIELSPQRIVDIAVRSCPGLSTRA